MNNFFSKYHFNLTEKDKKNYNYWKIYFQSKKILANNNFSTSFLMPPPNITGNLHLGHSLNLVLQDFLVRSAYLKNQSVYWISGIDHAGIATQKKIESLNLTNLQTPEQKKIYTLNNWYPKTKKIFFQQWEKLGLLVDYQNTKFTLDLAIQKQVKHAFIQLYQDGLIYRDKKLVNWDPQLKSVISDIEVEHKLSESKLYYLKYPLANNKEIQKGIKCGGIWGNHQMEKIFSQSSQILNSKDYLTIATSRPETVFADVALFVNPQDQRYKAYIGQQIKHPITQKIIPILADEKIIIDFGTGVLKCTPGHDFFDYELGKKYQLPIVSCYDEKGVLNDLAGKWQGKEPQKIRTELVQELQKKGICLKVEIYQTNLTISQRSQAIVEPLLSTQWFLNLPDLIKKIEQKNPDFLEKINFSPPKFKKTIEKWKEKTHEWCISRQLWWGHSIPVWYHKKTGEIYVGEKIPNCICQELREKESIKPEHNCLGHNWEPEKAVLDTWFSSGLWPITTTNQEQKFLSPNSQYFPITYLITGSDILFFWVLKMLLLGYYFTDRVSFQNIYLHGLIRDNQGKKMSKSLGNGVEPEEIIEKYGADSLRLFLLENQVLGSDLTYEESKIKRAFNFIQKLWSIGNFLLLNLEKKELKKIKINELETELNKENDKEFKIINTWILVELQKLKKNYFKHSEKLQTNLLAKKLIDFTWQKLSNDYLELAKIKFQNSTTKKTLIYVYQQILLYLHPFIPFVTEYLYQKISGEKLLVAYELPTTYRHDNDTNEGFIV